MVKEIKNTIYNCSIVQLPKIHNRAGNITALENNITVPSKLNGFIICMIFLEVKHVVDMHTKNCNSF